MVCVPRWQQSAFSRPNPSIRSAPGFWRHYFSGDSQSILRGPYFVPFKCGVLATAWICWHCHRQFCQQSSQPFAGVNSVWATVFGRLLSIACGNIVPSKVREPAFAGFLSICSRAASFDPHIRFSASYDRTPAPFESVSSYFGSS